MFFCYIIKCFNYNSIKFNKLKKKFFSGNEKLKNKNNFFFDFIYFIRFYTINSNTTYLYDFSF